MAEKIWKYVYEDDILVTEIENSTDPALGKEFSIRARNGHLYKERPQRFDTRIGKAYIYSDVPIDSLTLVDTDMKVMSDTIRTEDLETAKELAVVSP